MPRRDTPLDAARIVHSLAEHDVDYLLIGGLAVQAHGHVRTTQDADVFPAPGKDNARRLVRALRALNARLAGTRGESESVEIDLRSLRAAGAVTLDTDAGGVDIHWTPPGSPDFAAARERAFVLDVAGVTVLFVGRDDLIAMKRASGRPIDRGDIAALTRADSAG